jgi:hypothetical protein
MVFGVGAGEEGGLSWVADSPVGEVGADVNGTQVEAAAVMPHGALGNVHMTKENRDRGSDSFCPLFC